MSGPDQPAIEVPTVTALVAFGIYLQSPWGIVIAILGVVPLASGLDNFCLAGPLFGGGVDGRRLVK